MESELFKLLREFAATGNKTILEKARELSYKLVACNSTKEGDK